MSRAEWQQTYQNAWNWYYTDEHVETLMRRNHAYGIKPMALWRTVLQIFGAPNFEGVHPQQFGYMRRKDRLQRRPELPIEPALTFYPKFWWESFVKYGRFGLYAAKTLRMRYRVEREFAVKKYADLAITPVVEAAEEHLEMFDLNDMSRAAVEKARKQAHRMAADAAPVAVAAE